MKSIFHCGSHHHHQQELDVLFVSMLLLLQQQIYARNYSYYRWSITLSCYSYLSTNCILTCTSSSSYLCISYHNPQSLMSFDLPVENLCRMGEIIFRENLKNSQPKKGLATFRRVCTVISRTTCVMKNLEREKVKQSSIYSKLLYPKTELLTVDRKKNMVVRTCLILKEWFYSKQLLVFISM